MTGILWGLDASNRQRNIDLGRAARGGYSFGAFKCSEGHYYRDPYFARNLALARRLGWVSWAYPFMNGNSTIGGHMDAVRAMVPKDCAVAPDIEPVTSYNPPSRPTVAQAREFIGALREDGYRVPLAYLPGWYWEQLGRPDISDLPPLWESRYVSGSGFGSGLYERVPPSYWDGFGGNHVEVLQFASTAHIAGLPAVDVNAYRGSRAQLNALINGTPAPAVSEEEHMSFTPIPVAPGVTRISIPYETGKESAMVAHAWLAVSAAWGDLSGVRVWCGHDDGTAAGVDERYDLASNNRHFTKLPEDSCGVVNVEFTRHPVDGVDDMSVGLGLAAQPK